MEITVEIKTVYGNDLIYPVCPNAKSFLALTKNTKTLGKDDIEIIKQLGYIVNVQQEAKRL